MYVFDKKWGMLPLCSALGGTHYDLIANDQKFMICPLSDIDTEKDRMWALEYLEMLYELRGVRLNATQIEMLSSALIQLSDKTDRSLHHYSSLLMDNDLKQGLDYYINLGSILKGTHDTITTSQFNVFEMIELMNLGENSPILPAVLFYLFRKLEKEFVKGYPSIILLDEVWALLKHKICVERLRKWIKELRSFNVAVGFATQNLSDLENSELSSIIKENCHTQIFLPNPYAKSDGISQHYKAFNLNDTQIELIAGAQPKKHYYYSSPNGNRLFELQLNYVQLCFLARTSAIDVNLARQLYNDDPNNFGSNWLLECAKENPIKYAETAQAWSTYWLSTKSKLNSIQVAL